MMYILGLGGQDRSDIILIFVFSSVSKMYGYYLSS